MMYKLQPLKMTAIAGAIAESGSPAGISGAPLNPDKKASARVPLWLVTKPISFVFQRASAFGRYLIAFIRAIIQRICGIVGGVQAKDNMSEVAGAGSSAPGAAAMSPVVDLAATGEDAAQRVNQAASMISAEVEAAVKDIASKEPNLEKLSGVEVKDYLASTLSSLSLAMQSKSEAISKIGTGLAAAVVEISKEAGLADGVLLSYLKQRDEAVFSQVSLNEDTKSKILKLVEVQDDLESLGADLTLLKGSFRDHCVAALMVERDDASLQQGVESVVREAIAAVADGDLKRELLELPKVAELSSSNQPAAKNIQKNGNLRYIRKNQEFGTPRPVFGSAENVSGGGEITSPSTGGRKSRVGMSGGAAEDIPQDQLITPDEGMTQDPTNVIVMRER